MSEESPGTVVDVLDSEQMELVISIPSLIHTAGCLGWL